MYIAKIDFIDESGPSESHSFSDDSLAHALGWTLRHMVQDDGDESVCLMLAEVVELLGVPIGPLDLAIRRRVELLKKIRDPATPPKEATELMKML